MTKRVVLQHMTGPLKGLWRITGSTDELPAGVALPDFLAVNLVTHQGHCNLVSVRGRYVLYREVIESTAYGPLNPEQE